MNKNLILLAAIGGAVLLVLQKQAQAAAATTTKTTSSAPKTVNVAGDMWTRLLGAGWLSLTGAQNPDGTQAFLMNNWGQVTTSDGKPVDGGDPIAAWTAANVSVPTSTGNVDYTASLFPTLDDGLSGLGWVQ